MRSAYCLRGRFYGTVYSLRIYPISSAEEHQIRSAFSASPLPHCGVLAMTLCELMGEKCIGDRGRDKVFRWTDDSFTIGIARLRYLSGSYFGGGVLCGGGS
jgi:hypothetical protein